MTSQRHGVGWVGLTAAILDKAPALQGAACVGKSQLFDSEGHRTQALQVCSGCPVRRDCISWVRTISKARVTGTLPVSPRRVAE